MNLADDLRRAAERSGDQEALVAGGDRITYAHLAREVDLVAAGLAKLGVRKGDRVAFAVGNRPPFTYIHYGALRAGAVSVPMSVRLRAQNLRELLPRIGPRVIVADEAAVNEVMAAGPHSAPVFVIGKHPTARPWREILFDAPARDIEVLPGDPAVIAHTSATTGLPKAVVLSHGNISANLDQILSIPDFAIRPEDVIYAALPLHQMYALNAVLALAIRCRASVVLEEGFDPRRSLQTIADRGVTVVPGIPPMFAAWLALPPADDRHLSKVRLFVCGGSKLAPSIGEGFRRRFGIQIWEGYGLTEATAVVTTTRASERRSGSVGKPLPGQEVRIVDGEGEDVLVGDPGEILVRGPNVSVGYWGDTKADTSAFDREWLHTGDIGYQDEDGFLWLLDRDEEVIEVSGFKVYPEEVERVLRAHEAVTDAAVVGEPDPKQGMRVKAFVVLREDREVNEDQLVVYAARRLARFKVPSTVVLVEGLPRLESGEIDKRRLVSGS